MRSLLLRIELSIPHEHFPKRSLLRIGKPVLAVCAMHRCGAALPVSGGFRTHATSGAPGDRVDSQTTRMMCISCEQDDSHRH
jgi:hypothetical protein